jgi:hypothetical protein
MDKVVAGVSRLGAQSARVGRVIGLFQTLGMVVFAFLLFAGAYWQYSLVEVRSKVTSAIITNVLLDEKTLRNMNTSMMAANYEFMVGTEKYTGTGTMRNPVVGNAVTIEYNPVNPRDNAIDVNPVFIAHVLMVVAVCVLFGAGFYFWIMMNSELVAVGITAGEATRAAFGGR